MGISSELRLGAVHLDRVVGPSQNPVGDVIDECMPLSLRLIMHYYEDQKHYNHNFSKWSELTAVEEPIIGLELLVLRSQAICQSLGGIVVGDAVLVPVCDEDASHSTLTGIIGYRDFPICQGISPIEQSRKTL